MASRLRAPVCSAIFISLLLIFTVLSTSAASPPGQLSTDKAPPPQYAPHRIIVAFGARIAMGATASGQPAVGIESIDSLNARFGVERIEPVFKSAPARGMAAAVPGSGEVYLLTYTGKTDPLEAAGAYAQLPEVRYAEPDYMRRALRVDPDDPYWTTSNSWAQGYRDQWDMEKISCPDAWAVQTGDPSLVIAVSDTGIDYNHPDIAANMWHNPGEVPGNGTDDDGNGYVDDYYGYDFALGDGDPLDGNGHGTHCAGTIGAVGNNATGIAGINWRCSLMAVKGLDDFGSGYDSDLADGIRYAADMGARVISMSWGGPGFSQTIHDALEYAHGLGAVLCVAGGNDAADIAGDTPASENCVITVAASTQDDESCYFTNWGTKTAVTAPGGNGLAASPPCAQYNCLSLRAAGTDLLSQGCGAGVSVVGGSYYRLGGTSMACPHVSGVAGLILAQHPSWTNEQVRQAIQMRADDVLEPGFDRYAGFGRLNALRSVTSAEPLVALITSPLNGTEVTGVASIQGSVGGPGMSDWVLDYGPGFEPAEWTVIATGAGAVESGTIADWDLSETPGGAYTLRLRANGTGAVQNAEYRMAITIKTVEGSGHFSELFEYTTSDLAYKSMMFTPDGSAGFYSLCVEPVTALPTDPAGGYTVSLSDDDWHQVGLPSGTYVSLYGASRNSFYIGSNGYITFDAGDMAYSPSYAQHFSLKRISALFSDLNPESGGSVSWKLLADRVAVTWQNVRQYGSTLQNTLQIEMFLDGRIGISYLDIPAVGCLTGISAGTGLAQSFSESDLSAYPPCIIPGRVLRIVEPNGGEWYEPGTSIRVEWAAPGIGWESGDTVSLQFSLDGGAAWEAIPGAGSLAYDAAWFDWNTTGVSQSDKCRVRVVCNADPAVADASNAGFTLMTDNIAPVIAHTPLGDTGDRTGPYDVCAKATDNLGVASVWLSYSRNDTAFIRVQMNPSGLPDEYCAAIPGPSSVGDRYCCFIEAVDASNAQNPSSTDGYCFNILPCSTDTVGGMDEENAEAGYTRGNVYACTSTSMLTSIEHDLVVPTQTEMRFSVYESDSLFGTFVRVHETVVPSSGTGLAWYGSGAVSVPLIAGRYYVIAASWQGTAGYFYSVSGHPTPVAFGRSEGGYLSDEYPPGDIVLNPDSTNVYHQRLTTCFVGRILALDSPRGGEWYEPGQTVPIEWTASGPDWQPADTIRLEYSDDSGSVWHAVPGAEALEFDAEPFSWVSTGLPSSTHYRVRAVFNGDDAVASSSLADFAIAPDSTAPQIQHAPLGDTTDRDGPYVVCAAVTDNLGVGQVTLYWRKNGGELVSAPMLPSASGDQYCASIPGPSLFGDTYSYSIAATDVASVPNTSRLPVDGEYSFSIANMVYLPVSLTDGEGFVWDVQSAGHISDGSLDAFDGGFVLVGFPAFDRGLAEDGNREIAIGPGDMSGVIVTRKIFVPSSQAYCRFLEVVTNGGSGPVTVNIPISTNLGSDSYTNVVGTSSGDSAFDKGDQWVITDDSDGGGDPAVTQVVAGAGSPVAADQAYIVGDNVYYSYPLDLAPGETRIIMHFGVQSQTRAAALARASQLAALDPALDCLAGMSAHERSQVANFILGGRSLLLHSPVGGEFYEPGDVLPVIWSSYGPDWQPADTVRIEYSGNGGTDWAAVPGAAGLPYESGSFAWDTTGAPESDQYRVRVVFEADDSVSDASGADFSLMLDAAPPVISHTPLQDTADHQGPYAVEAEVTDNKGVGQVTLYWRKNGGAYSAVPMAASDDEVYSAGIPGHGEDGDVYCYYITAADTAGAPNVSREPASGEICFSIISCRPPSPADPYPADGASGVSIDAWLGWNGSSPGDGGDDDGPPPPPDFGSSSGLDVRSTEVVLDAFDRGWWNSSGLHEEINKNTFTGLSDDLYYRSYFAFDLSSVQGVPLAAALRLELEQYYSLHPTESLSVHDVSTPVPVLVEDGNGQAVYDDLGTGNSYAGFTVASGDVGSVREIPLSGQALADIGSAIGGHFAVGVTLDTISGLEYEEGVRFSQDDETRIHQLVLTVSDHGPTTYDLYMGPSCSEMTRVAENLSQSYFDPGTLLTDTTYYWRVVAKNACGETAGPCWTFSTEPTRITRPADESVVEVRGAVVSAVFPDCFYIESPSRESGIMVRPYLQDVTRGSRINVAGSIWTNDDAERYIQASEFSLAGEGAVSPIGLCSKDLGGTDCMYDSNTGAGQKGVTDCLGLNNIGLLVRITGKVTSRGRDWFYVDDGSGAQDGTGITGVYCEVQPEVTAPAVGAWVSVTGISSCEWYNDRLVNVLKVPESSDIAVISSPIMPTALETADVRPRDARR